MTESDDNLESRLASLRPRSISPSLETRIDESLHRSSPPGRAVPSRASVSLFWTTVTGGAIAASTILVLLTSQSARPLRSADLTFAPENHQASSAILALAGADWRWGDDLNLNTNESRRLP